MTDLQFTPNGTYNGYTQWGATDGIDTYSIVWNLEGYWEMLGWTPGDLRSYTSPNILPLEGWRLYNTTTTGIFEVVDGDCIAPTPTNTQTPTSTLTPTPTNTQTPTSTLTPTPTNTQTPTNTGTPTQTPTLTNTPTSTEITETLIDPIITENSEYIIVGNSEYLMFTYNEPSPTPTTTVTPSITTTNTPTPTVTPPLTCDTFTFDSINANTTTNSAIKTSNGGWDASAYSVETYTTPVTLTFQTSTDGNYLMGGFSYNPTGSTETYENTTYGLYLQSDFLEIYENGGQVDVPGSISTLSTDVWKVEYNGTNVTYYKNNVLIYTSSNPVTQPLHIFFPLLTGDEGVTNVCVIGTPLPTVTPTQTPTNTPTITQTPTNTPTPTCARPDGLFTFTLIDILVSGSTEINITGSLTDACNALSWVGDYLGFNIQSTSMGIGETVYNGTSSNCTLVTTGYYIVGPTINSGNIVYILNGVIDSYPICPTPTPTPTQTPTPI